MASPLDPSLEHLGFVIGSWHGLGVLGYPDMPESQFEQELTFSHDERPFLPYSSSTWLLDADGKRTGPGPTESGYWRPGKDPRDVEALIAHPSGLVELSIGEVVFNKVELATDLLARTQTADEVTAMRRLYGLVEGDLAYAIDVAARGNPLQAIQSARLHKVA